MFLQRLLQVPDLRSAWLLLLFCAAPRSNHLLRLLPLTVSKGYAKQHDSDLWDTFCTLVSQPQLKDVRPQSSKTKPLAELPSNLGGLSLRSAEKLADAAYWAAWADTLKVLKAKVPHRAATLTAALEGEQAPQAHCLAEVRAARDRLAEKRFQRSYLDRGLQQLSGTNKRL